MRSGTSRGNFLEVRDGSGEPRGGPGRVEGLSGRSGTGRVNLEEVRDGSEDYWGGPGLVGELLENCGRIGGP